MEDTKLNELQQRNLRLFLSAMEPGAMTKEEFLKQFKSVIDFVKKIEANNLKALEALQAKYDKLSSKTLSDNNTTRADIRADFKLELGKIKQETSRMVKAVESKITEVKDGLNGKDADEDMIVGKVIGLLPEQKETILDDSFDIRNKLETLNKDERLSASAISGLDKFVKDSTPKLGGGGGFSKIAMDRHFLPEVEFTGTKNGVNKVFTIPKAPNPINSLQVFRNGQRLRILAGDYTFSNITVTFNTAPESDEDIYATYMI